VMGISLNSRDLKAERLEGVDLALTDNDGL